MGFIAVYGHGGKERIMEEKKIQQPSQKSGVLCDVYALLHDLVYILAGITLFFVFVIRLVGVSGPSMMPTLQNGDYVALLSNFLMGDLKQGDIIVARKQSFENGEPIVKRVIATEGQTVDLRYDENGVCTVCVDNQPLQEDYINEPMLEASNTTISFPVTVDEGCIFVMGDNRNHSADSRYERIGQIEKSQVLGKVLLVLFPGKNESRSRDFSRIGGVS